LAIVRNVVEHRQRGSMSGESRFDVGGSFTLRPSLAARGHQAAVTRQGMASAAVD
jgi:hypothetical protein